MPAKKKHRARRGAKENDAVGSPPHLPRQALTRGVLLPVRPHVNAPTARTALAALHVGLEPRNWRVTRIALHVDQRLVAAGVVQAIGDQVMHAQLAHVAERHRRGGFVALLGNDVMIPGTLCAT